MALSVSSYKGIVNKNLDVYFFMNIRICTYLIDAPFINQKAWKDIRISYTLKYKHSKK